MIAVSESLTELKVLVERDSASTRKRAGQEFEAMVLAEMLKSGSKPLMGEGLLDGGSAGRMAREQFYSQLALEASRNGGIGLGAELEASAGTGTENSENET